MNGRTNVLGVAISTVNPGSALMRIHRAIRYGEKGYICVTGVHGVMEAQADSRFRTILNRSLLTTPDGMPVVWVGRVQGNHDMGRVYGPDLMASVVRDGIERGYRHFLFGGDPGVAEDLGKRLCRRFRGAQIVGTYTPPYRPLDEEERREVIEQIQQCRPHIVWVGLSTPKQERFMSEYITALDTTLMIGVGAAFDIHTGRVKEPSRWIKKAGLQWAHRLAQEPRRLWRRYLYNNPRFIYQVALQMSGLKQFDIVSSL
jgi:N-acetylglucosaminyldiphosphoundecaprenol N-acetyl-beta-D-mannosaminyltransferase